ncbi:UNVERIFIED_CONTAM: hypothetical protein GTU68_014375 [Idotea baltica]|nr:hypothetical protein [Idotea baltica]
MCSSPMEARNR